MSITKNEGGVLRAQTEFTKNDGGVLRKLKEVTECKGGVLRKIFSKASGELPISLAWSIDTSISGRDTSSKINSVSDDGLTIDYAAKTNEKAACICSNTFSLKTGETVNVTPISLSGSGTTADTMRAYLHDASGTQVTNGEASNVSTASNYMKTITLTAPTDGEYQIRLGGYSMTGAQTSSYYTSTVNCEISFSAT